MKILQKSILLFSAIFFLAAQTFAVNYYVKTTGNNANNGLTYATAFKTIQKALDVAAPGTTIFVGAGTFKERLWWSNSGSADNFITLTNYNGGIVYVDGSVGGTNSAANELLAISGKSFVKVENIRFRNNYRAFASGIYVTGAGRDIQISNCYILNIGWTTVKTAFPSSNDNANPLVVVGNQADSIQNLLISGNQIYNCITGYSEGMAVNGNVSNFEISGNTVHDITNIGIVCAGHYSWTGAPAAVNQARNGLVKLNNVYKCVSPVAVSAGIYVDGGKNIVVERNRSYSNGTGFSVGCENDGHTASNIRVRNNWSYNNKEAGIYFGSNAPNSLVTGSSVTNNSFHKNYTVGGFGAEMVLQNGSNNAVLQNIFVPKTNISVAVGMWGYSQTNFSLNYNLYWRTTSNHTGNMLANIGPDLNPVLGDPKFVYANTGAGGNYHLQTGSAAINAGDLAFVPAVGELDWDGENRVQQSHVDIGADETNLAAKPDLVIDFQEVTTLKNDETLRISPNPVAGMAQVFPGSEDVVKIYVMDLTGRVLENILPEGRSAVSLDCSNWKAGLYFVVCEKANGERETKRFSKL